MASRRALAASIARSLTSWPRAAFSSCRTPFTSSLLSLYRERESVLQSASVFPSASVLQSTPVLQPASALQSAFDLQPAPVLQSTFPQQSSTCDIPPKAGLRRIHCFQPSVGLLRNQCFQHITTTPHYYYHASSLLAENEVMELGHRAWHTSGSLSLPLPVMEYKVTERRMFHTNGVLFSPVVELKLAQTGEGIAECELLQWFVREGEEVKPFQMVCQVQSDKATVDITSRYQGRVVRTHFVPGDVVKVGETLLDILEDRAEGERSGSPSSTVGVSAAPEQSLGEEEAEAEAEAEAEGVSGIPSEGRRKLVKATPAVRDLARSYGVNLADVEGTGREGRVMKEDVVRHVAMRQVVGEEVRMEEAALEGPSGSMGATPVEVELGEGASAFQPIGDGGSGAASAGGVEEVLERVSTDPFGPFSTSVLSAPVPPVPTSLPREDAADSALRDIEIPIRGYRRAMVKAMAAASSIPHFNFMDEFDVTALSDLLFRLNASPPSTQKTATAAAEGAKLTHLSFLVKALSVALLKYPTLNATVDPDVTNIKCSGAHNIGIAMATPQGLVVPNIKNCEALSMAQIASEISRLRQLAATNQLSPAELANGTITISNIGAVGGGTYACPLVFQPQLAIVAIGRVRKLPRFDTKGDVCAAAIMNVSWAADHRVVDGATLAGLSIEWQRLVERPELLLLNLH